MTACNGCTVANALTPGARCVPCVQASCARRYEVGDGTVERCMKPRGHDDRHGLLLELERGALEAACAAPLEGPITAEEARVRSANRFLLRRQDALEAEIARLRGALDDIAESDCAYGDACPALGSRHGQCTPCKAREALKGSTLRTGVDR